MIQLHQKKYNTSNHQKHLISSLQANSIQTYKQRLLLEPTTDLLVPITHRLITDNSYTLAETNNFYYQQSPTSTEKSSDLKTQVQQKDQENAIKNIFDLTIVLMDQNQQLATKIEEVKKHLLDQQLKHQIFSERINKNKQLIEKLKKQTERKQKLQRLQSSISSIPDKSLQLGSTINTNNTWLNEFCPKETIDQLWEPNQKVFIKKPNQIDYKQGDHIVKVKSYSIDLSSALRNPKPQKESVVKIKMKQPSVEHFNQKDRIMQKFNKSIKLKKQPDHRLKFSNSKLQDKINIAKQVTKNLGQMRMGKKIKINPQI